MKSESELYNLVVEAYKNAVENGYDLDSMCDIDVAFDMIDYDADLQDCDPDVLEQMVHKFRSNR